VRPTGRLVHVRFPRRFRDGKGGAGQLLSGDRHEVSGNAIPFVGRFANFARERRDCAQAGVPPS
jgi:hypothetical protein